MNDYGPAGLAGKMTMHDDLVTSTASKAQPGTTADVTPAGPRGYELLDEIGRGGMGIVYRARDLALGRDVAVKLLAQRYPLDSPAAQRFVTEARITGQLQHPGIPAVHQVGYLPDGRPFLAMKLIKGCTLEAVLKDRPDPSAERGRLLAVFEAVCQAVGYAHAHRVIHRDLKPANVMVGAFGEVQVMDWGLAKVLGEEGTAAAADASTPEVTRAWTEVSPSPEAGSHTQAGSLVGTPAFIPPEQAAGELTKVDERADVFGLGALLAVILTGKPPYVGESFEAVRVLAVRGKLDDCLARLEGCGAEPELVALCKQCLAFEPAGRPANAGAVAQAVSRLRSVAEERARTAEREKVAADARAEEQRRKRRWQLAAGAVVLVALVGGLVGLGAYLRAQAQANADLEATNADLAAANEREKQAKDKLETTLYLQRIALAHRELSADNLGRAEELLEECPVGLRQWEWYYLKRLCRVEPTTLRGSDRGFNGAAFSPDGRRLATADENATIGVFDVETGQRLQTLRGHEKPVFAVAFHPDGRRLASTSADRTVKVWDLAAGQATHTHAGSAGIFLGGAYGVAFSPDGCRLAAGQAQSLKVWDVASGQLVFSGPGHKAQVTAVAFSPDGRLLASGSFGGDLHLWDARTGEPIREIQAHEFPLAAVAFHPDGRRLATGSYDRLVKVWDVTTGEPLGTLSGHRGLVVGLAFSRDGRRLASTGEDKTVKLWDTDSRQELLNLLGHTFFCSCVTLSPNGRRLASASMDGTVRLWDASPLTGGEGMEALTLRHDHEVWSVAFSPDGRLIASGGWDKTVRLWDAASGTPVHALTGAGDVFRLSFNPADGKYLASIGGTAGRRTVAVKVWDVAAGREVLSFSDAFPPFCVTFSPDGRYLLRGGDGHAIRVRDARTGQEVGVVGRHNQDIWCLTFSPDGRLLASASTDWTVKLWDATRLTEEQKPLQTLPLRVGGFGNRVAFTPDGRHLVTGGEGHLVKFWDVNTGQVVRTFAGHTGDVLAVAVSRDGRRIASAGEDTTVRLWDAASGKLLHTLRGHTGLVGSVAFSPDGRRLVSGSRDHTVKVWDLTPLNDKLKE